MYWAGSQQIDQFVDGQFSLAQNALQRPAFNIAAVLRHDDSNRWPGRMFQDNVTAGCVMHEVAATLECRDQATRGDSRQRPHAARATVRRRTTGNSGAS